MAQKKQNTDISGLSFEQAIDKLTTIVDSIESGETPLAESIEQYEKGMAMIKHCREILNQAEKKIETISEKKDS